MTLQRSRGCRHLDRRPSAPSPGTSSPRPTRPKMDFVFTVCDNAAGEACPIWPGQPMTAHWGIEDPAAVEGTDSSSARAFDDALRFLRNRIAAFINLPHRSIDRMALGSKLRGIGAMDGSTTEVLAAPA